MSLNSNNCPDINTLLSYRDLRAIGHEELMKAGLLVNKKQKGIFSCYYEDTAIDDFISAELYDELAGFSHDQAYSDHLFLTEIVLDTLNYSKKPSAINRRLKLFCFKNMMLYLQNEQELYRTDLFRFFLFFHPCKEDLIRSFVLNSKGLSYNGEQIDLHQQIKMLFETIVNKKSHFPSLSRATEQSLSLSRDIVLSLLQSILHPTPCRSFLDMGANKDLLARIFTTPALFFDLYQNDRKKFFRLLEENIDQYLVKSWDNDPKSQATLYYGPARNEVIENYFNRPVRLYPKRKYLTAFFIDLYVFHMLRQPAELENLMTYFINKPAMQLKMSVILFSHPFYNGEAKLQLVRSGKDTLLPDGFWTERLKKMKGNVIEP